MKNRIDIHFLNSLNKTINNEIDLSDEIKEIAMLRNEAYSFFIAITSDTNWGFGHIKVSGISKKDYSLFTVNDVYGKYVNVYTPEGRETDDFFIHKSSGHFPEILFPYDKKRVNILSNKVTLLFITIKLQNIKNVTTKNIKFSFSSEWGDDLGSKSIHLNILNNVLSENDLLVTHWFHYDCLAEYYNINIFSKQYYKVLGNYLDNYVSHGNTMLLVPLFTPCLDTEVGHERLTTQLIDVALINDVYEFNFDKLKHFLSFVKNKGIKYFEFSHLFTQWGAKFCPKIVVNVNGHKEKRFGWNVASDSEEYYSFLSIFLPKLDKFLKENNYDKISYFHISDEPNLESIEIYKKHRTLMKKYLKDYSFIDALSEYSFKDYVDIPVVSDDHINKYLENKSPCMTYYCCAQGFDYVPNIFINMPSIRNRIIGFMMYLNDTLGFLQWGYNFYHSVLSRGTINPYLCNDGMGVFNPGDPFIVYPGIDYKPVNSIRNVVFNEAIQDYQLCKTVEKKIGKEKTKEILLKYGIKGFTTYPHKNIEFFKIREELLNTLK